MKVLFVVPYPKGMAPSQRFRFEHYLESLKNNNISWRIHPFWSVSTWRILYHSGFKFKKIIGLIIGFVRRFILLFSIPKYNFVYIHREATPVGPAWFEWVIAKVFRKKIIYDFDDAIWIPAVSSSNNAVRKFRNFSKVSKICKLAYKITPGNEFLAEYSKRYNDNVLVIPTVVNTEIGHNKIQNQHNSLPALGWTGTFSTLKYLDIILPSLKKLQEKIEFKFVVIADKDPKLPLLNYEFIKWNKDRETEDLLSFHIGVMPLYDDEISKGKCGFKAIQYMSLGIPAIVSPVGVNSKIVDNGINGFVCYNSDEWDSKIVLLLKNEELRTKMGLLARRKIVSEYSVVATTPLFLSLFR